MKRMYRLNIIIFLPTLFSTIVDRYIDNKLGEATNKAIQAHNFDCREEAQAEKREYIELVDSTSYGEVFSLNKSRYERDKDRDPFDGSYRGTKRRKSSKDDESSKDLKSKEKKSSSTFKDASQSQHKSSNKSTHAEEPSHTLKTHACNKIKSSSQETMMNNPRTRRLPKLTGSRNPNDLQLLILIGVRDNMLTFDLLRPGLVKLHLLKNLLLHLMSSMTLLLISLHFS
nr:hypothetical protein [Tanacetum cinerariifolium]